MCFFLQNTLYKCLTSCFLSWYHGHAYWPKPGTWPRVNVQCEPMVSVFLGFTIPCAFVSGCGMCGMCCTVFQVVLCFSLHSAPFFVIGNIDLPMWGEGLTHLGNSETWRRLFNSERDLLSSIGTLQKVFLPVTANSVHPWTDVCKIEHHHCWI